MKKFGKGLVGLVCILGLITMFGCVGFQDIVTPCHIDVAAIEYAGTTATSYTPYTSVWDAKRVRAYMNYMHVQTQTAYERLQQDDSLSHAFLLNSVDANIADSVQLQAQVFNPAGPIGIALPALLGLGAGTFLINTPKKKKVV